MKTQPPSETAIQNSLAAIEKRVATQIAGRRRTAKVGIGTALVALVGIGGASAAVAGSSPEYLSMDGFVKTSYVQEFVECVHDADWDAKVLDGGDAATILQRASIDADEYSVVRTRVVAESQPLAGRAISACQQEIGERVGEPIFPTGD